MKATKSGLSPSATLMTYTIQNVGRARAVESAENGVLSSKSPTPGRIEDLETMSIADMRELITEKLNRKREATSWDGTTKEEHGPLAISLPGTAEISRTMNAAFATKEVLQDNNNGSLLQAVLQSVEDMKRRFDRRFDNMEKNLAAQSQQIADLQSVVQVLLHRESP